MRQQASMAFHYDIFPKIYTYLGTYSAQENPDLRGILRGINNPRPHNTPPPPPFPPGQKKSLMNFVGSYDRGFP